MLWGKQQGGETHQHFPPPLKSTEENGLIVPGAGTRGERASPSLCLEWPTSHTQKHTHATAGF